MADRTLTIRGVADAVLARLRARAAANRRSLNGELLAVLDRAADDESAPHRPQGTVREPAAAPYAEAAQRAATLLAHVDRGALEDVCRRHHIVWLAVFGSRARGDAVADSDVDVVVDFAPGMTPGFGIVRVADALRPVLGGHRVDLVTRRGLSPRLREQILSSAKTLYAAE
jgi:predicted nucleotidyltransferase/plasmid stability protein